MPTFDEAVEALIKRHPINEILRSIAGFLEHEAAYLRRIETEAAGIRQVSRLEDASRVLRQAARKINM